MSLAKLALLVLALLGGTALAVRDYVESLEPRTAQASEHQLEAAQELPEELIEVNAV